MEDRDRDALPCDVMHAVGMTFVLACFALFVWAACEAFL